MLSLYINWNAALIILSFESPKQERRDALLGLISFSEFEFWGLNRLEEKDSTQFPQSVSKFNMTQLDYLPFLCYYPSQLLVSKGLQFHLLLQ